MNHELGPLPEPDGWSELIEQPLPGGGYNCIPTDAWSAPLVRAYTLSEVEKAEKSGLLQAASLVEGLVHDFASTDSRAALVDAVKMLRAEAGKK